MSVLPYIFTVTGSDAHEEQILQNAMPDGVQHVLDDVLNSFEGPQVHYMPIRQLFEYHFQV